MVSSSRRVISSITLSGVLLLTSLPGVHMPVKAAEGPAGLETQVLKSSQKLSVQTVRSKLVASASTMSDTKDKPIQSIQIASEIVKSEQKPEVKAEVKTEVEVKTEDKTEVKSEIKTEIKTQTVSKPTQPKATQKPAQVASATTTSQVSRGGDSESSAIVKNALSLQGVPYVFGGTNRNGFDCSGFTQYVFKGSGTSLPRTSYSQFQVGTAVKKDQLQPGDLVFFTTYAKGASHVGIYIGSGKFVHAGSSGVQTTSMSDSYYAARYLGARRI